MNKIFIIFFLFLCGCSSYKLPHKNKPVYDEQKYTSCLIESQRFKNSSDYQNASFYINQALSLNPLSSVCYYQLAQIYFLKSDFKNAAIISYKAYEIDSKNEEYLKFVAICYSKLNNYDTTLLAFKALLILKPNNYDYNVQLATLYFENEHYDLALSMVNKIENIYGFVPELFVMKYQIFYAYHKFNKCLSIISKAINFYPDEPKFYELLAIHYQSLNNIDSAIYYYNRILSLDKDYENAYINLLEIYSKNSSEIDFIATSRQYFLNPNFNADNKFTLILDIFQDKSKFNSRLSYIREILDSLMILYPDNIKFLSLDVDYYLQTNQLLFAKSKLYTLLNINRSNYLVWEKLLLIQSIIGDYPNILDLSNQAILLFPDKAIFYLYNGISLCSTRDYSKAIPVLEKGLSLVASNDLYIKFYNYLGESYNSIGNFHKSDYYYQKAVSLDSLNYLVLNNYSYFLSLRNDSLEMALKYIQRCLNVYPKSDTYIDTYAWILFKLGRINESKLAIESAIFNGGYKNEEILEHYVEILVYLDNSAEALKYYNMILDMGKDSKRCRELLKISK